MIKKIYNVCVFSVGRLRAAIWKLFCKRIGKDVFILGSCQLLSPEGIEIGDYSGINHHVVLSGAGGLRIGKYVGIGQYSMILTFNHRYADYSKPICLQGYEYSPLLLKMMFG